MDSRTGSRLACLLVLAFVAMDFSACGSSNDDSGSDLTSKADSICADVKRRSDALPVAGTSLSDEAKTLTKSLAIAEPASKQLADLDPPNELQVGYDAWVAKYTMLVADTKKSIAAAERNDRAAFDRAAEQYQENADAANAEARKLGMTDCAQAGS